MEKELNQFTRNDVWMLAFLELMLLASVPKCI